MSFTEINTRIAHEVQVEAASLYEALAKGVRALQDAGWRGRDLKSDTVEITVFPKPPSKHRVLMKNFRSWLDGPSGSPEDVARRKLVREILGRR